MTATVDGREIMANTFLYTQRPGCLDELVQRLDGLGFRFVKFEDSDTAYEPARLTLATPWMGTIDVVWNRRWWDDGWYQGDDVVTMTFEGGSRAIVEISQLLRQKLAKPLAEVVTDRIVAALEELKEARDQT